MLLRKIAFQAITVGTITFCCQPAMALQEYNWSQGQGTVPLIRLDEGVCFLASVEGSFKGGGETVYVKHENGQWLLGGNSNQGGVAASAYCATWSELGGFSNVFYNPITWNQGQGPIPLLSTGSGVCYLSRMSGKFEGGGERIKVENYYSFWQLGGNSNQGGVSGSAYCIYSSNLAGLITPQYNLATDPRKKFSSDSTNLGNYKICFLTEISGKFNGSGEKVSLTKLPSGWSLQAKTAILGGVSVGARCIL